MCRVGWEFASHRRRSRPTRVSSSPTCSANLPVLTESKGLAGQFSATLAGLRYPMLSNQLVRGIFACIMARHRTFSRVLCSGAVKGLSLVCFGLAVLSAQPSAEVRGNVVDARGG